MTLLEAMARQEGFLKKGTRPNRNNNPGDIEYGPFAKAHGAIGSDGRFAIFPDAATGYRAMAALLRQHYAGLTVEAALNKYAPPVENDTNLYLRDVCAWANVSPSDPIDQHLSV